ncbi:MAG: nuclear transport factor 2 family protein [Myxococcales bacterium]|nr:nuclear transport factor 2 family protein [Myxococcales bacterium]
MRMTGVAMATLLGLLLLGTAVARASDTAVAAKPGVVVDEVLRREKEWAAALMTPERSKLEQMLGDEFTLTTAAGTTPRVKWMATADKWQTKAAELRDGWSVQVYGDVAIARGVFFWHVLKDAPDPRTGSKEVKSDFSLLDVWVKRGGRWQVVARHSILLAPPATPGH